MQNTIDPAEELIDFSKLSTLRGLIEDVANLLPAQGPIDVFVHHNTLHAFEELPFDQAVQKGNEIYGCEPYLLEEQYRDELKRGRINSDDLFAVLLDDLEEEEEAHVLIGFMGTRFHLRLAMLEHSLRTGPTAELRWVISESDALTRFREETSTNTKQRIIEQTRIWVMRDLQNGYQQADSKIQKIVADLTQRFPGSRMDNWSDATWESFTLHLLWEICYDGSQAANGISQTVPRLTRHRDFLLEATLCDSDELVNEVLIRLCAAFLDQGFASWSLPDREKGFFEAFRSMFQTGTPMEWWLQKLPDELNRITESQLSPLEIIAESLSVLGVPESQQEEYITQTLLALRGWAGMIWQMETNAEWAVRPAPAGTLLEFLAVRLLLERLALAEIFEKEMGQEVSLTDMPAVLQQQIPSSSKASVDERAYLILQLAQVRGWSPSDLYQQSDEAWKKLIEEIETFDSDQRRRVYHLAYERRYRNQTLDAIALQQPHRSPTPTSPAYQVVCCIDEREESLRRHLEEIDPECETFGFAGFFGVAMYYRGAFEAHYRPLCPVNIKPKHFVREVSLFSLQSASMRQAETRRRIGHVSHRIHMGSRTFLGGALMGLFGSLASFPLVMRVLAPRTTAQLRRLFNTLITPPATQLRLQRLNPEPGSQDDEIGYSIDEMADIVQGVLKSIGMTKKFAPLVFIMGHGSASLNNPHEAAHDCGACGGGRGGPNARAFAQMANHSRVRNILAERGLQIPEDVAFIGAYHNTCDDSIEYYDLAVTLRSQFIRARDALEQARKRDAHERCRRFNSADLTIKDEGALKHVEGRAEDLSQTRPEYGHATNAICQVGRRSRSRGLFLDRRSFLTSYDPTQDDQQASTLANILSAVIPVCAGINLEYYFPRVDPRGYGCGTKLPHNITSLLGVMDGAASDLRPGLPWQMVEIHEPVRILFVIETTPQQMLGIMKGNPTIDRFVRNEWVQLATLDPYSSNLHLFNKGEFQSYDLESKSLPEVHSSLQWYRGQRDHLGYAQIVDEHQQAKSSDQQPLTQTGEVV